MSRRRLNEGGAVPVFTKEAHEPLQVVALALAGGKQGQIKPPGLRHVPLVIQHGFQDIQLAFQKLLAPQFTPTALGGELCFQALLALAPNA